MSVQLLHLCQGSRSAATFVIDFRTLAAQSGWDKTALKTVFREGLNQRLQSELACKGEDASLSDFITLSIKIDNLLCNSPCFVP